MLYLAFKAGGGRFALPAKDVAEVTPLVRLSPVPGGPPSLAGLMNHRGAALPVVDVTRLITGRASRPFASTRILVTTLPGGRSIGLMAERVLRAIAIDPSQTRPPDAACAPYVSGVLTWDSEILQLLDPAVLPLETVFGDVAPANLDSDFLPDGPRHGSFGGQTP